MFNQIQGQGWGRGGGGVVGQPGIERGGGENTGASRSKLGRWWGLGGGSPYTKPESHM